MSRVLAATLLVVVAIVACSGSSLRPSVAPTPRVASPSPGPGLNPSPGTTSSPPASALGPAVLVGAGDIATCELDADGATARLLDELDGIVFTTGDNAYPDGTADQFRDCYGPTWGRHRDRTRPAPGNHDHETKGAAGYLEYFGERAAPEGSTWYSYDAGAWHVVVLDSECDRVGGCGPDSRQGHWLSHDLEEHRAACSLAIWHRPRYSSGDHGSDGSVAPLWEAVADGGVDIVVNGHDHDYERFAPRDAAGRPDDEQGVRAFVVGTGGAELRPFAGAAELSQARNASTHGVLVLTLHDGGYDWHFIPIAGHSFTDRGSGNCR